MFLHCFSQIINIKHWTRCPWLHFAYIFYDLEMEVPRDTLRLYVFFLWRTLKFHLNVFQITGWQNFQRMRFDTKLNTYPLPCHTSAGTRLLVSLCISQECCRPSLNVYCLMLRSLMTLPNSRSNIIKCYTTPRGSVFFINRG